MKRILIVCLAAVVVAAGGLTAYNLLSTFPIQPQSRTGSQKSNASRSGVAQNVAPDGRNTVAALGRLEPESETIDIGAPGDDRLGRLLVTEGQDVEKGAVLAYLESYAERLAEKNYVGSQLRDAKARLAAETAYATASIEEAQIRIRRLEELQLLDIQAQEPKVRQLEADLASAKKDLERSESLRQKGLISQQQVDHQRLRVRRVQEELNSTTVVLAKLKAAYDVNLLMARAQLKTARANLARAQAAIQLESLTKNLALAQARLDRTIVRAPISGNILKILTHPGETVGTQPLLEMGNTQPMYAVAEVYETDIRLVRSGQRARVSSPALPEVLTGTVVHIGSTISKNDVLDIDPAADTDARVVEVKIQLDQSDPAARLIHLQVHVEIVLAEDAGVTN